MKNALASLYKKNWKFILIFGLLGFIVCMSLLAPYKVRETVFNGEVDITYTSSKGFYPEKIVVKKGTKVNFRNQDDKDFWPASDFYPTNSNYPELNSNKKVSSGEIWSFVFNDLGQWGYHDNLNPINKGVVTVTEDKVYFAANFGCSNVNALEYVQRQVCWYNQIKNVINKKGVGEALKFVSKLYNKYPLFAQGCHDATHLIGDEAYRQFKKGEKFSFSVETSYCGYGFYHGFIEAILYTTGDYYDVRNFCESINSKIEGDIESPNAIYSCYHGIGHATFDSHDPSVWGSVENMATPALRRCEQVTKGLDFEKTKQCATGVFNALANAYSNNLYNLQMDAKDPVIFCRTQSVYREYCFAEVSMAWINSTMGQYNYKFLDGIKFIEDIGDEKGEQFSVFALVSDYVHINMNKLSDKEIYDNCNLVSPKNFTSCIEGVELAFLNWGKPGEEYKRAISFCDTSVKDVEGKNICFSYVFRNFQSLYSKEKRLNICRSVVPESYKEMCIKNE